MSYRIACGDTPSATGQATRGAGCGPMSLVVVSVMEAVVEQSNAVANDESRAEGWLLQSLTESKEDSVPKPPETLNETRLSRDDVLALILKTLRKRGVATGRELSNDMCLPFTLTMDFVRWMKDGQLLSYQGTVGSHDFKLQLSQTGLQQARQFAYVSDYVGPAPVKLDDYIRMAEDQSPRNVRITSDRLRAALSDLVIEDKTMSRIGQAMCAGRGMFLHGEPGNGKSSIAQRVGQTYGSAVWIPRSIDVHGEVIRVFDPIVHRPIEDEVPEHDARWVLVQRPTITAGGELTLDQLEVTKSGEGVCEAPIQLKANGGVLVVDDFGRQRIDVRELLSRWIVPLETRTDYLTLMSGRKIQVPFDLFLVFSTNMEPRDITDEAFLRRIPYKIRVNGPDFNEFRSLFIQLAQERSLQCDDDQVQYLFQTHFLAANRALRYCHARDLLDQVVQLCRFHEHPPIVTRLALDEAVENYFSAVWSDREDETNAE